MSVTRENRKIRDYLRKRLIRLAEDTGGEVIERAGAGGKSVSTYKWRNSRGEKSFRISWHNSVSDRYFPKKIRSEIKRNIIFISELFYEDPSTKSKILSSVGMPGRASITATLPAIDTTGWDWSQLVKPLNDFRIWLVGSRSINNEDYWAEEDNNEEDYPNDHLGLDYTGEFGGQFFRGQKLYPDDIFAFGKNAVFLFTEMDEISMLYANRSLLGWCERAVFWWHRRNPKFYTSEGVSP